MSGAEALRWVLFTWIGGSIAVIPTLVVAAWLRGTVFRWVERRWWRATAKRRRKLPYAEETRQRFASAHIRAAANHVIARDEIETFVAMEQEIADWQRQRRARDIYDQENDQ